MSQSAVCIRISLEKIAPTLRQSLGDPGYFTWTKKLGETISAALADGAGSETSFSLEEVPLASGSAKGPDTVLAVAALVVGLSTSAGYLLAPETTTSILRVIWSALRSALGRTTKVEITFEKSTTDGNIAIEKCVLKVSADDADAARSLLLPSHALLESLQSHSPRQGRTAVTFLPKPD